MARQYQSHKHVDNSRSTYSQGSGHTNRTRDSVSASNRSYSKRATSYGSSSSGYTSRSEASRQSTAYREEVYDIDDRRNQQGSSKSAKQNTGRRKSKRDNAISPGFVFACLLIAIMIFFFFFIIGLQVGPDLSI